MSKRLKEKLGEELYNQIIDKGIKENEFDLLDGYIPRQRLNEVSDKLKATEDKNKSFENQVSELKKLVEDSETFKQESEEFKNKYKTLEKKHKEELSSKDKELSNVLKKSLVKETLLKSGAKQNLLKLLVRDVKFDSLSVENEELKGFEEQLKTFKTDYKDMFIEEVNTQGNNNSNNSNNNNNNNSNSNDKKWDGYVNSLFEK